MSKKEEKNIILFVSILTRYLRVHEIMVTRFEKYHNIKVQKRSLILKVNKIIILIKLNHLLI